MEWKKMLKPTFVKILLSLILYFVFIASLSYWIGCLGSSPGLPDISLYRMSFSECLFRMFFSIFLLIAILFYFLISLIFYYLEKE
jgi:hypothetical protein